MLKASSTVEVAAVDAPQFVYFALFIHFNDCSPHRDNAGIPNMSKRSLSNRQRVSPPPRPRRLVSTFIPVLIGLSSLHVLSVLSIAPILPVASPLFAQSNRNERPNEQNQVVFFSIPIAVDAATVRSAPSDDAYSTGTVGKNRYVEAYFRNADGWCAIRPPQGSFSWINAKFVRRDNDSTGRVVASNGKAVPARVGGATVEESAIVQVGLKNGRQIKILDETRLANGSTWFKIAPPAGEFRWIHSGALLDDPALAQLPSKLTFQREFLDRLAQPTPTLEPALESVARSGQLAQNTQNGRFNETAPAFANVVPETLPASVVASGAPESTPTVASSETASSNATEETATQFKMEIARLNADVFQTLRQNPPSDADLAALASRAEYLFDAAPTDGERFVVQSIYDAIKIAERRNRSRLNGIEAAPTQTAPPTSPNITSLPAPIRRPPRSFPQGEDSAIRPNEFELENDSSWLVLPDSNFNESAPASSTVPSLSDANGFNFSQFSQTAGFNPENGVANFNNVPHFASTSNAIGVGASAAPNAPASEKRPRLAFAFSEANNPFRSRAKNKGARVAPFAPSSNERSSGLSKLPPLLPPQKQLIVPPPNYRSGPFGKNDAVKNQTGVGATASAPLPSTRSETTSQTAQELTVDSVRWRAVETSATASNSTRSNDATVATAQIAKVDATAKASPISATVPVKAPVLTGASVPQTIANPQTANKNKNKNKNDFQPVSSRSVAAFDAYGVLAKLPKAPQGTPQYALTRPLGADRFEIVSYLEAEKNVSLERCVGRKVGVQGTRGTIQIGENTQKLITVQTIFAQE